MLAPKPQFYFGQIPSDAESRKSMERVTAIEKVKRNEALTHPNRQQSDNQNKQQQQQQTGKQNDSSSQAAVGAVKSSDSVDSSKPVVDSVSTTRAAAKLQELFEVPQAPKLNSVTKSR